MHVFSNKTVQLFVRLEVTSSLFSPKLTANKIGCFHFSNHRFAKCKDMV